MKIWAHTLVQNEERYIWFSVMSVIEYVDKILIWDTGSEDKTIEIIKKIKKHYPEKVDFKKLGKVNPEEFTQVRQEMLKATKSDWFILVDGDEVWWEDSIREVTDTIFTQGRKLETIVSRYRNVVGDIYHYQEKEAGRYEIDGEVDHLTIRAMNRSMPGLYVGKPHGQQGYFDEKGGLIQERDRKNRKFADTLSFLHFTHMVRSENRSKDLKVPKRDIKLKYELGISFPLDFYYPEVFFKPRPVIVPNPWIKRTQRYTAKAYLQYPFRFLKRRLIRNGKSGY